MRWFKHMAESHTDEKLAIVLASHGLEGYGLWWLLVETIAHHTGKDDTRCSVSYPVTYWMRLTGIYHVKKLKMFVECFHNLQLISAECSGNVAGMSGLSVKDVLIISMPNILKYRDEYSKKSGQYPEGVRTKKQIQIQITETDKEKALAASRKPDSPPKIGFDYSTGKFLNVTQDHLQLWGTAYPAVNLIRSISGAAAWAKANPANRKKNWERFITSWLSRDQEKSGRAGSAGSGTARSEQTRQAARDFVEGV